ncbi:MAG TPA: hypothetical protein VJZ00_25870 [Thermoanaerobaculia bacterium]|nr:hypothetical protein [Thermoanaerobaculia bacterium]
MERVQRLAKNFFDWALAINGAALVLQLFLMFATGLVSMTWGRAVYFWMVRVHFSEVALALSILVALFFVVQWERRPPADLDTWRYWLSVVMRYVLAYVYLDYGFAKIFKGQFTTSLSTLDMPLGEISGFALAWRFFGYSYAYAVFLAASEIVGGVLMFFRRTTLIASAILLPVAVNIVVVNFTHGIGVEAEAILLLLITLDLFLEDAARLKALFWDHAVIAARTFPAYWNGRAMRFARRGAIAFIVLFTLFENVLIYVEYERTTTPLFGAWDVQSYRVNGTVKADAAMWRTLYVDTDRTLTIRTGAPHVVECESDAKLQPGRHALALTDVNSNDPFFRGDYETRGQDQLVMHGTRGRDAIDVTLRRRKSATHSQLVAEQ